MKNKRTHEKDVHQNKPLNKEEEDLSKRTITIMILVILALSGFLYFFFTTR